MFIYDTGFDAGFVDLGVSIWWHGCSPRWRCYGTRSRSPVAGRSRAGLSCSAAPGLEDGPGHSFAQSSAVLVPLIIKKRE